MGERFPAIILIGGQVPRSLIPDLIDVINASDVGLLWGGRVCFDGHDSLIAVLDEQGHLILCDDEASYGVFQDLECFLQNNNIAFDRHSDARYEYDGELVSFRPAVHNVESQMWKFYATQDGDRLVLFNLVSQVRDILNQDLHGERVQEARKLLDDILGPVIPPLPRFEVIPGLSKTTSEVL